MATFDVYQAWRADITYGYYIFTSSTTAGDNTTQFFPPVNT
jgi:hypothetical protein